MILCIGYFFNLFLLSLCGNFLANSSAPLGPMSVLTSPTLVPCPSPSYWEKNFLKHWLWILDLVFLDKSFHIIVKRLGGWVGWELIKTNLLNAKPKCYPNHTLRICIQTQFSQPTPELGPLQAEF